MPGNLAGKPQLVLRPADGVCEDPMAGPQRQPSVAQIVAEIEGRTPREAEALATRLSTRCWPAASDRHVPAAAEWVRRWGPNRQAASPLDCSCAAGRCPQCN
jgi:hypothetical protein